MVNLDNMIMDVQVGKMTDRVRVKFVAIAGGQGLEFNVPITLAETLRDRLNDALNLDATLT